MVDQITAVAEIDATLITTFLNDKFNEFISHVHYFGPKFKSTGKVVPSALNLREKEV